jgi:hypothetical protein
MAGGATLAIAVFALFFFRQFESPYPQTKKMVLRQRYWLYYALQFMSGARRQIFVVFAGFMMVEKFGFRVNDIAALFMLTLVANMIFAPIMGRVVARFGERNALCVEYTGLVGVFLAYGGLYYFGWGVMLAAALLLAMPVLPRAETMVAICRMGGCDCALSPLSHDEIVLIISLPEDITPKDPVSENMNILVGKPAKAFIYQDHDAHIATHQAFMQDPQIMAFIGQNPAAQQIMGALMAHIAEHVAFSYRQQIEGALGVPLPAPNAEIPEELEVKLASMIAEAAQQNTQKKQAAAAQQQAQEQAQDPIMQMQMQELQIKQAEQQRKAQKDQADAALAAARLNLDASKAQNTAAIESSRIAAMTEQADAKQNLEEAKAIMDLAKTQMTERNRG